jgi:DNA-binding Lrp family transcriptional regulator
VNGLKKLEENGIITGYTAYVDPKKVGKDITAFINVTVDSSKHYGSFIDHAKATDEVLEIHSVTGYRDASDQDQDGEYIVVGETALKDPGMVRCRKYDDQHRALDNERNE